MDNGFLYRDELQEDSAASSTFTVPPVAGVIVARGLNHTIDTCAQPPVKCWLSGDMLGLDITHLVWLLGCLGGGSSAGAGEDASHRRACAGYLGQVPQGEGLPPHAPQEGRAGEN